MSCDLMARGVAAVSEGQGALQLGGRVVGGVGGGGGGAVCHGRLLAVLCAWYSV